MAGIGRAGFRWAWCTGAQKIVVAFSSTAASAIVTPSSTVRMIVSATTDGGQAVASGMGHAASRRAAGGANVVRIRDGLTRSRRPPAAEHDALHIRLDPLSAPRRTAAIAELCRRLNDTHTNLFNRGQVIAVCSHDCRAPIRDRSPHTCRP